MARRSRFSMKYGEWWGRSTTFQAVANLTYMYANSGLHRTAVLARNRGLRPGPLCAGRVGEDP